MELHRRADLVERAGSLDSADIVGSLDSAEELVYLVLVEDQDIVELQALLEEPE